MAIEDIAISFHGSSTSASIAGKTINNYQGVSAGVIDSDLSGYDTGAATGVSIDIDFNLTADNSGRLAGVDALTQQINQGVSFSSSNNDNTYTVTFPSTVTSVDVEVFLCTTYAGQILVDVDINGTIELDWDSTNNTTGATIVKTGIVPNGSDQILIYISSGHNFMAQNGLRFFNIVDGAGPVGISPLRRRIEGF